MSWNDVTEALREAAAEARVFPGAVLIVGVEGKVTYHQAVGYRSLLPHVMPIHEEVVFDIASLTKAIVTTTLVMHLVEQEKLGLERRITRVFQEFGSCGKELITVRHLLTHSSGYEAYKPFYEEIFRLNENERRGLIHSSAVTELIYNEIFRAELQQPPGTKAVYSDIGFLLLGRLVETVAGGKTLDELSQELIFSPLGMRSSGYVDLAHLKQRKLTPETDRIAPTSDCKWRKKILCGEVQDENAWVLGGVCGHAGMFSTAGDVHRFAVEMINCSKGKSDYLQARTVKEFWTRDTEVKDSTWALGWDTPSAKGSSSGSHFSEQAVGHLGYTGCSLWIDPEREVDVVLLTNRVHPSTENDQIKAFRPLIHDLVMDSLGIT